MEHGTDTIPLDPFFNFAYSASRLHKILHLDNILLMAGRAQLKAPYTLTDCELISSDYYFEKEYLESSSVLYAVLLSMLIRIVEYCEFPCIVFGIL